MTRRIALAASVLLAGAELGSAGAAPRREGGGILSAARHPYLLFTTEELPGIRARSRRGIAKYFRGSLDWNVRNPGGDAAFVAFVGHLENRPELLDRAKAMLLKTISRPGPKRITVHEGKTLRSVSYAYDWLYERLSPEDRSSVRDFLVSWVGVGLKEWGRRTDRRGSNWEASIYSGFLVAGLVLKDEVPEASEWISVGVRGLKRGYLTLAFDPEGAPYESYSRYVMFVSFYAILPAMEAYRRVTGEDLYQYNDAVIQRHMTFLAYMLFPTRKGVANIGDTRTGLFPVMPILVKTAAEYGDGLAAWYLKALLEGGVGANRWGTLLGLLWARDVPAEDPDLSERLSLAKAYVANPDEPVHHGTGHVFLRTGFTRPDDIQFVMQAGDAQGWHGHADKGSYILHALGEHFIQDAFVEAGYGNPSHNWFRRSEAHNIVLIDDEGQGCQGNGLLDARYTDLVARIESFRHTKTFDYVRADLREAYLVSPAHRTMKRALRHVVFLRGIRPHGSFVVIDDFQKDDDPHTYAHAFHPGPGVRIDSIDRGRIVLKGERAACHVAVLNPEDVRIEKRTKFKDAYVKATCAEKLVRLVLVTVLYPCRIGAPAPISCMRGPARITVEVGPRKVTFRADRGVVSVDGEPQR